MIDIRLYDGSVWIFCDGRPLREATDDEMAHFGAMRVNMDALVSGIDRLA